jgi:hypothetical protein
MLVHSLCFHTRPSAVQCGIKRLLPGDGMGKKDKQLTLRFNVGGKASNSD